MNLRKSLISISCAFVFLPAISSAADVIFNENFQSLFNSKRAAQPARVPWAGSYFSYEDNGTAVGVINGAPSKSYGGASPIFLYDQMYNGGKQMAYNFEMQYHSCEHVPSNERASCEAWWGHCNGWAGAAVREKEPTKTIEHRGQKLEVGHQKGLLSEMWLAANASFVGDARKDKKTGRWVYENDPELATYRQLFWDTTPRQLVLSFMNQIGVNQLGVIIDRFTGDEVWNQPVVGYRILPIRSQDLGEEKYNGKRVYTANLRMKIYWANDNVPPGHISDKFNINATSDDESGDSLSSDYSQRNLRFKLFFDQPLQMDASGTQILNKVRLVGDGLWYFQEHPTNDWDSLNHSHPDFVWIPENAYVDYNNGYGNPHIDLKAINEIAKAGGGGQVGPTPPPPPTPPPTNQGQHKYTVDVDRTNLYDGADPLIAERLILRVFTRAGLKVDLDRKDVSFQGSDRIVFTMFSNQKIETSAIRTALENVEVKVNGIN